jgi:hypothetical protein
LYNLPFLDLDASEAKNNQEIDNEFDQIIDCVQARRKVLKNQFKKKLEVRYT